VAFGTCRRCGAFFEQMDAVCPVCGAAAGRMAPSVPTLRNSHGPLADKNDLVPSLPARGTIFGGVFVAITTVLGAAGLGVIGGWPMGILGGALVGLSVGGLVSGALLVMRRLRRK
jgi:hypothetical protein